MPKRRRRLAAQGSDESRRLKLAEIAAGGLLPETDMQPRRFSKLHISGDDVKQGKVLQIVMDARCIDGNMFNTGGARLKSGVADIANRSRLRAARSAAPNS